MKEIDPAKVMAEHAVAYESFCRRCFTNEGDYRNWPCEPYRLAEALAAREKDLAETSLLVGEIRARIDEFQKTGSTEVLNGRWF